MSVGPTVSIRVPPGIKEELKAATGLPFSTVARYIIMAVIAHYRSERRENEARGLQNEAKGTIQRIASEVLAEGIPEDEQQ